MKIIDKWTFRFPISGLTRTATVHMRFSGDPDPDKTRIEVIARSEHLQGSLSDTDINALHARVLSEFQRQEEILNGIAWEEWLEVTVSSDLGIRKDGHASLSLSYRRLPRGVDPKTGNAFTLNHNKVAVPFPEPKQAGVPEKDSLMDGFLSGRNKESEYSYIPATPENVAALETLIGRVRDLKERVAALLSQQNIEHALSGNPNIHRALAPGQPGQEP